MKNAIFFCFIFQCYSLQSFSQLQSKQNIINEIGSHYSELGSHYSELGSFSNENKKQKQIADSFFNKQSISDCLQLNNHYSYTIKYYSFMRILQLNKDQAYNVLLQHITDSTKIIPNWVCMIDEYKFNVLIASNYSNYITLSNKNKQFCTGGFCFNNETKMYKKEYKKLKTGLKQLLIKNNIFKAVQQESYLF